MKTLFVLVVVLAVLPFKAFAQNKAASNSTINALALVGEWGQYVIEFAGGAETIHCYECPTVVSQANSTGLIKFPNGKRDEFKWQLVGNKLTILIAPLSKKGRYHSLTDGIYEVIKHQPEQYSVEIALVDNYRIGYILRR